MQISLFGPADLKPGILADHEFLLVEKKFFHVELHLRQSQVRLTVGVHNVALRCFGSRSDGAVHQLGTEEQPSLQAGDISMDLPQKLSELALAPQLIIQKSQVMADTRQTLDGRRADLYLWSCLQLNKRR